MIDYSGWPTKQQAADALAVSTKKIEALAKDGKLQQAMWRRPGGGARIAVYHPEDVARIAQERQPAASAFVLPAAGTSQASNGNGHGALVSIDTSLAPAPPQPDDDSLRLLFAAALRAVTSQSSEKSISHLSILTLAQAEAASGWPQKELRRCIAAGTLVPVCGRSARTWRIRRRDLEAL
jgi:hypothetical protein